MLRRALPPDTDLAALQAAAPSRFPLLLESVAHGPARADWDLLLAWDGHGLSLDAAGDLQRLTPDPAADAGPRHAPLTGTTFLAALDAAVAQAAASSPDPSLPFTGGWALYLGYELAGQIEPRLRLPRAPADGLPTALALRCPAAILRRHGSGEVWAVWEPGQGALLDDLPSATGPETVPVPVAVDEDPPQHYLDGAARVIDYLRAGDVFQVNLSRGWSVRYARPPDPAALYAALRRANPAPFAGCLRWEDRAVISSSPERLVSVRDGLVETRPIAGTRPRLAGDDMADRIRELVGHPKERAEHIMLLDLERNDLGRVCQPGSVRVDELMTVESYAHVHHIVSNVSGRLRPGVSAGQVIAAVFPGGTITGCPKVRCMEIIAELEQTPRGAYTGAFGWLDRSGDLDLNILIRTLQLEGDTVTLRAGAGIVVDSQPEAELAETRAKARGLLRALGLDG